MVFVCHAHVFVFCFAKCFRDADGGGEADSIRFCCCVPEKDAGVAVGDHHFQAHEKFGFDLIEAGAGIEIIDHIVYHEEGVFFHNDSPFLELWISGVGLFEISILLSILEIKYIYLKSVNFTPEIKHCIRTGKRIVYQYQKKKNTKRTTVYLLRQSSKCAVFCFRKKELFYAKGHIR